MHSLKKPFTMKDVERIKEANRKKREDKEIAGYIKERKDK